MEDGRRPVISITNVPRRSLRALLSHWCRFNLRTFAGDHGALTAVDEINKLSDVNEEKKLLLKNGQTPGGGQSEASNRNGSKLGAGTNGGQTKGGASPKSGSETDGRGAGKPTKGASSQA